MNIDEALKNIFGDEYEESLNEGLIRTVNPDRVYQMLNSGKYDVSGYPILYDKGVIGVRYSFSKGYPSIKPTQLDYEILKKFMNNMGFFPSQYRTVSTSLKFKAIKNEVVEDIIKNKNGDLVEVVFHPKFSTPLNRKDLPSYLYHVCDGSVIEKIKKIGLSQRTGNKIETHPERVYFCISEDCLKNLLKHKDFNRFSTSKVVFVLKIKLEQVERSVDFYEDPSADGAIYTYQNIPPSIIQVVKELPKK